MLFTKELADNLSILRHDAIGPLQGIREGSRTHLRATAEHGEWFNEWDGQVSRAYSELRRPISTAGDVTKVRQAARDLRPLALEYLQRLRAMNLDRKALARADRHVQQFLPMLDQIDRLDFSIAPYRAPVDLSELLRNELAARDYYDKHGRPVTVGMRLDHNAIVHANPQLITRVVDNLLQDASLHPDMDDKTPVHLRITTTRTDAGYLRLRVVSLGAQPLTDKLMAAIGHERFSTRQPDGTVDVHGVGKISAWNIVEAHGGTARACNYKYRGKLHPVLEFLLSASRLSRPAHK